jgi:hypothetical protein
MMLLTELRHCFLGSSTHRWMQCFDMSHQNNGALIGTLWEADGPQCGCRRLFVKFPTDLACPMHEALQIHGVTRAATEDGFDHAVEAAP